MIRSFLKGGIFYKTPQLHENASISKDSDIVNKWYVDTKVNNTQINTKQYVDSRVASIPIVDASSLVNISGNQNIYGTKYFNSSPTVPNPTSGTHAANKAYVDSKVTSSSGIGVGQTWQAVSGLRAIGTTYTNSTGRPIQILVQYRDSGTGGGTFKIGSLAVTTSELKGSINNSYWFSAVIPDGVTYSISGGVILPSWWELR